MNKEKSHLTDKVMSLRMSSEMYHSVRKISYLLEKPISQVIRDAVSKMLREQKDLTKR